MAYNWTTEWPGVYAQHASDCPLRAGGDCTCARITYRASAKAPDERSRVLSPEFPTAVDARNWLRDQRARLTAATAVADEGPSVGTVIHDFLASASRGLGSGPDDPSRERLRQVTAGLGYVDAELGPRRIQTIRRRHIQALVDQLEAAGMSAELINSVIDALRVLFSYAIQRDLVDFNPIVQLRLPAAQPVPPPPPPMPPPPPPMPADLSDLSSSYYTGNGNGNGNPGLGDDGGATMPYTPAFTAPYAPPVTAAAEGPSDHWTPGVFDQFEFRDDPFATEPPPPVPPRAPYVGADPLEARPYPAEPTFAPPASAMPIGVREPPLAGAETRYGTPTYGTEAVTTQAPVQPAEVAQGDGVMLSEQMFWWITRIVVIVFVLIALVLAAESV